MVYPYLTLNVPESATSEEIRTAYLKLVHKFPPEHYPEKFQEISEAYEVIKDEIRQSKLKIFGTPKNEKNDGYWEASDFINLLPKPEIKKIKIGVDAWMVANTGNQ